MALSKIKGTVIADDAINADRIADGTVVASDLLDNTLTGAKLATDIAITTSGNITTTGAFTSVGIDDNATSTAITIDSSERVGIGETSPDSKLEVKLSSSGNAIKISGTSNNTPYLAFENEDGGTAYVRGRIRNASNGVNGGLVFDTGSSGSMSEAMRIDTSGKVGIGTSSPYRQLQIYDDGTIGQAELGITAQNTDQSRIFFADPDDVNIGILDYDHSVDAMRFTVNNSERMRINSSGNVGIGTSSPSARVNILESTVGTDPTADSSNFIKLTNSDVDTINEVFGIGFSSLSGGTDYLGAFVQALGNYSLNFNHSLIFGTRGTSGDATERMRIDSAGNVGIGTSSPQSLLHIVGSSTSSQVIIENTDDGTAAAPDLFLYRNSSSPADSDSLGNIEFRGKNSAGSETRYVINNAKIIDTTSGTEDAQIEWQIYNNGSFQKTLTMNPTEIVINEDSRDTNFRVESDNSTNALFVEGSSGNVGIGTSSPNAGIEVVTGGSDVAAIFSGNGINIKHPTLNGNLFIGTQTGNDVKLDSTGAYPMLFFTNGTERMRISGADGQQQLTGVVNSTLVEAYNDHASSPFGYNIFFRNASPDNNANYFLNCSDSTTARARIESDGDLQNHDNSYGSISDERIKQDIRDSNSQWNDIKNVRVRNFKKKDDVRQYGENAWEQIGVVAQELETVSPKLIKHSDPAPSDILSDSSFGTLYQEGDEIPEGKNIGDVKEVHQQVKAVNYSVLYMKSIKALQEAMERIETLETKVQTLENNQP